MTPVRSSSSQAAWTASELAQNPHTAVDKAERVRRMFAAIAHRYDLNNRVHSFGRDQAWRRRAVSLAGVRPGDRVLDAACGTGDLAEAFAAAGAIVTGVDFTAEMIDLARAKAARIARAAGVVAPRYTLGDVTSLPFQSETFDIVSIAFGIRNVDEPMRAIGEFDRVLRPGGRVVILEFSQPRSRALRSLNRLYCERVMPVTATLLACDRSGAYRYLPRSVNTFLDREQLASLMIDAGFASVTQHPMTFGVCVCYVGQKPRDQKLTGKPSA